MKKIILTIAFIGLYLAGVGQTPRAKYEATITEADLEKHLTVIASDEMEGRDTGSEGQKRAAEYIITHLKDWGLKPVVNTSSGKSYLQNFSLYKSGIGSGYIHVNNKTWVQYEDYIPGFGSAEGETHLETVFVGYGRQGEGVDDYAGKDVKGKAVVYFTDSPDEDKAWSGFQGTRAKMNVASENGAAAVIEISSEGGAAFKKTAENRRERVSRFSRLGLDKSIGTPQPGTLPSYTVSKELGAELIKSKTKRIDKYLAGKSSKLKNRPVSFNTVFDPSFEEVKTANIIGMVEGSDKKDEVVVLTAHYDHLGVAPDGQIYNGADDDGSGTVAIMKIAEAFAQAKKDGYGPRRSVMFMWVTGEERGLLGSSYYVDRDPVIPMDQIICDLNIDMIGRIDKKHATTDSNSVYLVGSDKLSSELHAISERMNKNTVNMNLDYELNDPNDPQRIYYRSDHYNFAKPPHKIPVIFYFTGIHEDYHKVTDTVDKILFPKYTKITRLVFNTAWELANIEKQIVVDSNKP